MSQSSQNIVNNNFYFEGKFSIRVMLDRHAPVEGSTCSSGTTSATGSASETTKNQPHVDGGVFFYGLVYVQKTNPEG